MDRSAYDDAVRSWQVVAHEIGHATLDLGGSKISEEAAHAEAGLRGDGNELTNSPERHRFTGNTLKRMRSVGQW